MAVNVAPIDEAKDEWVMISPYGEFKNSLGLQIFNRDRADKIVVAFNSVLGKLGRLFRGVPIYRGHPYQRPDIWPDDRRYGRLEALEARADGLYGKPAWNSLGTENIKEGFFVYPSPGWYFDDLGNGRIAPKVLDHVGLTNSPNIGEVQPLTNSKVSAAPAESEQTQQKENMNREALIKALGLKAEATDAEITTAINSLQSEHALATNADKNPLVIAANGRVTAATDEAKKFKKLVIDHELDLAVNDGRLTAAERPIWAGKFETDFDKTSGELKEKQPALNTKTLNLTPSGKDLGDASKRRIAFNSRLDELMRPDRDGKSLSLDQAINAMRSNKEDAALLEAMQQPLAA
jgi:phage I-like protein